MNNVRETTRAIKILIPNSMFAVWEIKPDHIDDASEEKQFGDVYLIWNKKNIEPIPDLQNVILKIEKFQSIPEEIPLTLFERIERIESAIR